MTDKELKRLNRAELLEMLLAQMEENRTLNERLQAAEAALADREIAIAEAGTLAEAALKLNGVFEAADEAARQYVENIRRRAEGSPARQTEPRQEDCGGMAELTAGTEIDTGEAPHEEETA